MQRHRVPQHRQQQLRHAELVMHAAFSKSVLAAAWSLDRTVPWLRYAWGHQHSSGVVLPSSSLTAEQHKAYGLTYAALLLLTLLLQVQGVLSAAAESWPHIHISDSLVMADAAVKMAKAGCTSIAVLGVDFMSENVRAILDEAGLQDVQVR